MKPIAVVRTGCVGLTTGACVAELGNVVVCVDIAASSLTLHFRFTRVRRYRGKLHSPAV